MGPFGQPMDVNTFSLSINNCYLSYINGSMMNYVDSLTLTFSCPQYQCPAPWITLKRYFFRKISQAQSLSTRQSLYWSTLNNKKLLKDKQFQIYLNNLAKATCRWKTCTSIFLDSYFAISLGLGRIEALFHISAGSLGIPCWNFGHDLRVP